MKSIPEKKAEHPSARVAKAFLEEALRTRQFLDGDWLPPLRALAGKARVSPASMLHALHQLQSQGLVTIVKNHGTYAGKPEDRVKSLDPGGLEKPVREKWQRLRVRLEQDIYSGRFAKGADLPSLRDLAPRYATSPPTLRKAVALLIRAGVLEAHGRKHRVPRPTNLPGQAGIPFTAWLPPEDADLWFRRDWYVEFLASLHRACAEANLRLLVSSYHPRHGFRWRNGSSGSGDSLESGLKHITLQAHLAWAPNFSERELQRFCSDLARLHPGAKPVRVGTREMPLAIFDGAKGLPMAVPRSKDYACTRIFSIFRKQAGEQVARFLLAAGHSRIAFLSACHQEPWSKDRLFGLRRACEAAGFPEAVKAFTVASRDEMADKPELTPPLAAAETEVSESLLRLEQELERDARAWLTMPLRTSLELFRAASRTGYALEEPVGKMRAWAPSACVAANDVMALTAMRLLRKAGVRIPEEMVFVGFDDDRYASDNNLSTYNFNMAFIAQSMLRYVLAPEKAAAADKDGAVECQGVLIERSSTPARPAPAR